MKASDFVSMIHSLTVVGATSFDEISSLPNLTSLFIRLDSSSIFNRDHTWMKRLKSVHIELGKTRMVVPSNESIRIINVSHCDFFSNGELSGMLQFASDLHLERCMGLKKVIAYNSFDGLKSLYIYKCSCDFRPVEKGSGQIDPLPNLEHLTLDSLENLKCVSDFSQLLSLRFSKLRQLNTSYCRSLTCLFNTDRALFAPKHLENITISYCEDLVEFFVPCSSSQIPRVWRLWLESLPKLGTLGSHRVWEHLEELRMTSCLEIRKLPLSLQTSNDIKLIRGESEWWHQLEWDDENFK